MNLFNRHSHDNALDAKNSISNYTPRVDDGFDYDKEYNHSKTIQYNNGQTPNDVNNNDVRFMLYHDRYGYIGFDGELPTYEYDNQNNAAIFSYQSARYYQVDFQSPEVTIIRLENINQYSHLIDTDKQLNGKLKSANQQAQNAQQITAETMSNYANEIDKLNQVDGIVTLDLSEFKLQKEATVLK